MTDEAAQKPDTRGGWARRSARPKIPPEAARRQGLVTRLALETFATKDEAIAYLNGECSALGARPLDLAIASNTGFEQVVADLQKGS